MIFLSRFVIFGDFISAAPYGSGHINDTYAVVCSQAGLEVRYIFQRINPQYFQESPSSDEQYCSRNRALPQSSWRK